MQSVLSPNKMYQLDNHLIDDIGISEEKLMEGAALNCKQYIEKLIPQNSKILVLCGTGNNGGDGLALARYLNNEHNLEFTIVGNKSKFNNSVKSNYDILTKIKVRELVFEDINLDNYDVIVDSVLGIGSNGKLTGHLIKIIRNVNLTNSLKIAIDMPTGINPKNGVVTNNNCFKADYTITMYSYKTGLFLNDGKDYCGSIYIADIGITKELISMYSPYKSFTNKVLLKKYNNSSKFEYGKVLVIAGSFEMPGAASLAANSAISSGAGLVYLLTPKKDNNLYSEIICVERSANDILLNDEYDTINNINSVVIGPGLGKSEKTKKLVESVVHKYHNSNIIIDADALNYININNTYSKNITLTPHIVEFSRIINVKIDVILENIPKYVKDTANKLNLNIVLKGPTTVISDGEEVIFVTNGLPEMATAGSGDVLSGILGAYINFNLFVKYIDNIANAVFIHNEAANNALEHKSQLIASDIYGAIQCLK